MRQQYYCTACGLRVAGRVNARGQVIASDRSATSPAEALPCLCRSCAAPKDRMTRDESLGALLAGAIRGTPFCACRHERILHIGHRAPGCDLCPTCQAWDPVTETRRTSGGRHLTISPRAQARRV